MADENKGFKLGAWAFIIGLILAIIVAIVTGLSGSAVPAWAVIVLAILGIIVGLLNVTGKEAQKFLVAAIAFLLSFQALSNVFMAVLGWKGISTFFSLLGIFMAPAAAVVAIRALFLLSKD